MSDSTAPTLVTLDQFRRMTPTEQGFIHYMQAAWPGSELPKQCPYAAGTKQREQWDSGASRAVLLVQDMED